MAEIETLSLLVMISIAGFVATPTRGNWPDGRKFLGILAG
jgi:hypothetical protein